MGDHQEIPGCALDAEGEPLLGFCQANSKADPRSSQESDLVQRG